MSNPYFSASGAPSTGGALASAAVRTQFASIQAAFDLLPALTANRVHHNNAGGTAGTTTSGFTFDGTTLVAPNMSTGGTLAVTGVATFTAQPIASSLTASQAVFTDGSKGLVSNAITGTGNVVMSVAPTITGHPTIEGVTSTGATGTGNLVFSANPTFTSPTLGAASATSLSGAVIADQAAQEAASSAIRVVTPADQHFHPSATKASAKFTPIGATLTGYGVSSVTDSGGGLIRVTWTTAFSSANYPVNVSFHATGFNGMVRIAAQTTTYVDIQVVNASGTGTDPLSYHVIACGDLP